MEYWTTFGSLYSLAIASKIALASAFASIGVYSASNAVSKTPFVIDHRACSCRPSHRMLRAIIAPLLEAKRLSRCPPNMQLFTVKLACSSLNILPVRSLPKETCKRIFHRLNNASLVQRKNQFSHETARGYWMVICSCCHNGDQVCKGDTFSLKQTHSFFFCSNALVAFARSLCKCLLAVLITANEADTVASFL